MKIAQLTGVISDEHHRGKLIKARVAACKQCGELSVPVLSDNVKDAVRPDLYDLGWRYRQPGGWHCPGCISTEAVLAIHKT